MRHFFYNLSVRNKILIGFFLVTAVFFCIGIYQYNSMEKVNSTSSTIKLAKDMNNTAAQLKYLLANDMLTLRSFNAAKNEKELKSLHKEHVEIQEKLAQTFNSVITMPEGNNDDMLFRKNFRDTIIAIQNRYKTEYTVSYDEIYIAQLLISNPAEVRNIIRQKQLDIQNTTDSTKKSNSLQPQTSTDSTGRLIISGGNNNNSIEQQTEEYILDLKYEQKKHFQIISRMISDVDKVLTIIEVKSSAIANQAVEKSAATGRANIRMFVIFILVGIVLSIILAFFISNLIVNPLSKIKKYAARLAEGELPEFTDEVYNDEIGETANSIEQLTIGLQKTSDFAYEIGRGEFSTDYQPLSDKDVLGNSLLNMRKSLVQANREQKKRQREDIQRNWTTEGQAKFAEILRHHTDDITELSDDIIVNLVKYLKANQGGIFIYNDTDPNDINLELLSAYAYNRKKFIKRKIKMGEGLVGAAALEKYTIYLTDIPDNYIEIESGIGSANPKALLIVPLKIENDILGVIELASFNNLKDYEIELVEKIAESIASTLQTARINTRTAELLEQSNQQTRSMKDQEEEMRQTIEEMQANQEDAMHREETFYNELKEMEAIKKALEQQSALQDSELSTLKTKYNDSQKLVKERENYEHNIFAIITAAVINASEDGTITYVNDLFTNLLGYKSAEALGRSIYNILGFTSKETNMAQALQAEFGNIVNTKGREVKIKTKDEVVTAFWLTITANIFEGKIIYTFILDDLSQLTAEREKSKTFEEEMLTVKFESDSRTQILEKLLRNNNVELPGLDSEFILFDYDELKINLSILDNQHKKWFDIINRFYSAFKRKENPKVIMDILTELIDYTEYHFGFKEKYLKDFHSPYYESQKSEHQAFLEKLQETISEYANNQSIALIKMIIFIKEWSKTYFPAMDETYIKQFKANGLA